MVKPEENRRTVSNVVDAHAGVIVQAGNVSGGIHFPQPYDSRVIPRELPRAPDVFVDRENAFESLGSFMAESESEALAGRTVSIVGLPGVGKTAFAVKWCNSIRGKFPDGDIFIDLLGYGGRLPLSMDQAMGRVIRSLGVPKERVPSDPDELAGLYRSLLATRSCLVLFDNASSKNMITRLLPAGRGTLLVFTSREQQVRIQAGKRGRAVNLEILSLDDGVALLAQLLGDEKIAREPEAAAQLVELCGFLPLALRLAAQRAALETHLSLGELVEQLESRSSRLDLLETDLEEAAGIRAVFSWSYLKLSPDQRSAFRLLALHPGADFGRAAAATMLGMTSQDALKILAFFIRMNLLESPEDGRYRMHDLLRIFATERFRREVVQRSQALAVRRVITWYLRVADAARQVYLPYSQTVPMPKEYDYEIPPFPDAETAVAWFETERHNLLASTHLAIEWGFLDLAWKLPVVTGGFFELLSYWEERKAIHRIGLAAAAEIGDQDAEAAHLMGLGDVARMTGDDGRARDLYSQAIAVSEGSKSSTRGFSLYGLGRLLEDTSSNPVAALEYLRRALSVFEEAHFARGKGLSFVAIGRIEERLGREGRPAIRDAVDIFREIGDRWSEAWALQTLGGVLLSEGNSAEAVEVLAAAVATFRNFQDRRQASVTLLRLGDAYQAIGTRELARSSWQEAYEGLLEFADPRAAEAEVRLQAREGG